MAGAIAVSLSDIVDRLGGELVVAQGGAPEPGLTIDRIGSLENATPSTIAYLANPRLRPLLASTRAGCVIVAPALRDEAARRGAAIVTAEPQLYFARLTQWWVARVRPPAPAGVHPSAVVDPTAHVEPGASIGPLAVVDADARIDAGAVIGASCFVGRGAVVGAGTRFAAQVTFGAGCRIGARGLVHSGAVIGADGFGLASDRGRWEKIEQLGAVRIGDDVEIGANTCIDRGALDDTVVGDGVKLDNLVQLGHNVRIGDHTAIAGCVGIAGSAVIGRHCTIGGAAMMVGHVELADHVHISGGSLVNRSIREPGRYTGIFPIDDNAAWEKNAATLRNLHALRDRVRALERTLERDLESVRSSQAAHSSHESIAADPVAADSLAAPKNTA